MRLLLLAAGLCLGQDDRRALQLTDLLLEERRYDEAEQLIVRSSDTAPWLLRLARLRAVQKRHSEAAGLYKRLLDLGGDDSGLLIQLGEHAFAAGEKDAARRAFLRARELTRDGMPSYFLSELAESDAERRRWAKEALERELPPRVRLRVRSRLEWTDGIEDEFGRLYDGAPRDKEILGEWAGALIKNGSPEAAREPIALLKERFPQDAERWRRLEYDRARDPAFLEETVRALPEDLGFRLDLGQVRMKQRRWQDAEDELELAWRGEAQRRQADELLVETRLRGWHHAGPFMRWRQSRRSRSLETGASYGGYPRRGLRVEGEASRAVYRITGREDFLAGGLVTAAVERPRWSAGGGVDAHGAFAGPMAFGDLRGERWGVEADASHGVAWRETGDTVLAGARAHLMSARGRARPARAVHLGLSAEHAVVKVDNGGRGRQTFTAPEALFTVLDRPFFAAVGWRHLILDASGDDPFFRRLPLLRRSRMHYGVAAAGKHWRRGRVRLDGYGFAGWETGRRAAGLGLNLEVLQDRVRWLAGFETTSEDVAGVGGRSRSVRLAAQWRWKGR